LQKTKNNNQYLCSTQKLSFLKNLRGKLVEIPLRNKIKRGIIFTMHDKQPPYKTKPIQGILENAPHLTETQLKLLEYISNYYLCPLYKTLKLFIPSTFFQRKKITLPEPQQITLPSSFQPFDLSDEQINALESINKTPHQTILLHGITGSGKTEIYRRLTEEIIKNDQQILILIPEISLTPQTAHNFEKQFGNNIAIIHSQLSAKKKQNHWLSIQNGYTKIIIGSRSAIFAPFQNLGMIVIDEEHEDSYKQEQAPRYDVINLAQKIIEILKIKIILGSATPSLESYFKAKEQKYELIELKERVQKNQPTRLPEVTLVDLREEIKKHNFSIFSELLSEKIRQKLAAKEQIILFLNRRGAASAVICRECGHVTKCPHCDIALTYHRKIHLENKTYDTERLICHHCGKIFKTPVNCSNCKSHYIKYVGIGTQKIEEEAKKYFPEARILRADRDTIKKEDDFKTIFQSFKNHEADILIGTQMIAKGLHLPKVNLVGVILADTGLTIPDFRSSEKTFQLLTQVAGRAGRESLQGEVIIQTYMPEHYAIQAAQTHNYEKFYQQELLIRNEHNFPPYKKLIKFTIADSDKEKAYYKSQALFKTFQDFLQKQQEQELLEINLYPALIPKLKNLYRWHILLTGANPREFIENFPFLWSEKNDIKIDVDPIRTV
jgi:primosomal protein N' (replication factor Y)